MKKMFYDKIDPFLINHENKKYLFKKAINSLTLHHYKKSKEYKKILKFLGYKIKNSKLSEVPFLPARLFKEYDLLSTKKNKISKTLLSSGTSGTTPSKIYLDKNNAHAQAKALSKIMSSILGNHRLPMLIIDKNPKISDRSTFNAKSAAIYGFSIFGKDQTFILDNQEKINYELLNNFLKKYNKEPFFIFGFTSLVFQTLVKKLSKKLLNFNFENGILLHGGGWKKMERIKISNEKFKKKILDKTGLKSIYNYYGLVEQTGSIFIECENCSCFVTSVYSEVLIRDEKFNILRNGKKGLIQLMSLLPTSYPGHSILTEDIGEIIENNKCKCSLRGTRFKVYGRAKQSEVRGCSDI